jgi:hypothetical protein
MHGVNKHAMLASHSVPQGFICVGVGWGAADGCALKQLGEVGCSRRMCAEAAG